MFAAGAAAAAIAVALYARSVYEENALPPGPPAVAGRILVERKRCIRCHKIAGGGGLVGPDLTLVATRKNEAFMVSYLSDPRAVDPNGKMPKPRLTEEQREAVVAYLRTLDGKHPVVPTESGGR
jgi:cytochrome c oxidase subunit 2